MQFLKLAVATLLHHDAFINAIAPMRARKAATSPAVAEMAARRRSRDNKGAQNRRNSAVPGLGQ